MMEKLRIILREKNPCAKNGEMFITWEMKYIFLMVRIENIVTWGITGDLKDCRGQFLL